MKRTIEIDDETHVMMPIDPTKHALKILDAPKLSSSESLVRAHLKSKYASIISEHRSDPRHECGHASDSSKNASFDGVVSALALLARMRFACGDNGQRMQDELEVYLKQLSQDAARWRKLIEALNDPKDDLYFVVDSEVGDLPLTTSLLIAYIDAAMKEVG